MHNTLMHGCVVIYHHVTIFLFGRMIVILKILRRPLRAARYQSLFLQEEQAIRHVRKALR